LDSNINRIVKLSFDLNYDYSDAVYYNITGTWIQIPYKGTPMIRPVFSKNPLINITENKIDPGFLPYPNPVNDVLMISQNENIPFSLIDITGKIVKSGCLKSIDATNLENGIYFLTTTQNNTVYKIVVQHQ
jgi:hypothetical protein